MLIVFLSFVYNTKSDFHLKTLTKAIKQQGSMLCVYTILRGCHHTYNCKFSLKTSTKDTTECILPMP